jgi:hypothetical protein
MESSNIEKNAYVYGHYKADTDELFYIGKGTGRRAWLQNGRSDYWRRVVAKHGLVVKILQENLTDEDAFVKEKELISNTGLENLVNMRDGGLGLTREDARKLRIQNIQTSDWYEKVKATNIKLSKDSTWRRNFDIGMAKRSQNNLYLEKIKQANIKKAKDPNWRKKITESNRRLATNPDWRKKMADVGKRNSENPAWRNKVKLSHQKYRKEYTVLSPSKEVVRFIGINEFCRNNNLHSAALFRVISGKAKTHKGWTRYIPTQEVI